MTTRKTIAESLASLPKQHRDALSWFQERAGAEQGWPKELNDGTLLATKAKGIYKPKWSEYALSIRQTLDGPYPDKDPVHRPDGTWEYQYYQENADSAKRDKEFTNKGLMLCHRDQIPVGVIRQIEKKPTRYAILGLALVANWEDGYFRLEGFSPEGVSHGAGPAGQLNDLENAATEEADDAGDFDPNNTEDARQRTMAAIVRRRGQPKFRNGLLKHYNSCCAITGSDVPAALEAAHITPYMGDDTNHMANGILLRADIHTLFDLGLMAIDESTLTVLTDPDLNESNYGSLAGVKISLPADAKAQPSKEALLQHRLWTGLAALDEES